MAKRKTLDGCIRQLLREGCLVPLYFTQAINALKAKIDSMTDDELYQEFCGLFAPKQIRNDVNYIFTTINDFIKHETRN